MQKPEDASHGDVELGFSFFIGSILGPLLILSGLLGFVFIKLPVSTPVKYLIMGALLGVVALLVYVFSVKLKPLSRKQGEDQ